MNRILMLLGLNFIFCAAFASMPMDSVGTTTKNGKTYVQHKVEKGETLYALSRKYNQPVDDIKASNGNSTALSVGEIVLIPSKAVAKTTLSSTSQKTHLVKKGETLYSISRETGVSVTDIKKFNSMKDNELSVGETLQLTGISTTTATPTPAKTSSSAKTHVVKKGETLYSISRETDVSVSDIKKFNNMKDNEISVGQELALTSSGVAAIPVKPEIKETPKTTTTSSSASAQKHTVKKGETLFSVSQKYSVQVNDLIKANNLTSSSLNEGQVLLIPAEGISKVDPEKIEKKEVPAYKTVDKPTKTAEADYFSKKRYERISEEGAANSWNGGSLESKYSYCLHKTAPIGTVIKITNKKNERFVYARVIGNDVQGANLITVNKTVQNRLEIKNDEVFNVTISYVK